MLLSVPICAAGLLFSLAVEATWQLNLQQRHCVEQVIANTHHSPPQSLQTQHTRRAEHLPAILGVQISVVDVPLALGCTHDYPFGSWLALATL